MTNWWLLFLYIDISGLIVLHYNRQTEYKRTNKEERRNDKKNGRTERDKKMSRQIASPVQGVRKWSRKSEEVGCVVESEEKGQR